VLGALLLAPAAFAQDGLGDAHLREDAARILYWKSAFAHGYRHGYEEGFHWGDQDLHVARKPQEAGEAMRRPGVEARYRSEFGEKKSFLAGFRQGFRAGYLDAYAGRQFRAFDEGKACAVRLQAGPPPYEASNHAFDKGFTAGYRAALEHAQASPSIESDGKPPCIAAAAPHPTSQGATKADSLVTTDAPHRPSAEIYCDGYQRGLTLGTADGLLGPPPEKSLQAVARP